MNTTIYGGQNTLAAGSSDFVQKPTQVQISNWDAVESALSELGVPDAERLELRAALEEDEGSIGDATNSSLGRLAGKLGAGSLALAEGVTVEVVAEGFVKLVGG